MTRHTGLLRSAVLAALLAILAWVGATSSTASAVAAPYCGIRWGSLDKQAGTNAVSIVTSVRAGQHQCYDRLVVDLNGPAPGYSVRYVEAVRSEGAGGVVPVRGGARLQIVVLGAANDLAGNVSYTPANQGEVTNVTGYRTFRQVAWGGTFEGYTTIGLGLRARLPFRVFTLPGPGTGSRLVVDVAHLW